MRPVSWVPETRARRTVILASFAEMAAPGRQVTRDLRFDSILSPIPSQPDAGSFSRGTWVMIVVAGFALGVAMTLLAAGS
jgi:hypothetical protein